MRRSIWFVFAFIAILAVLFLVPYLLRDTSELPTVGPRLDKVSYQEVAFQNADLELAGLLILPEGDGPFPAAVLIHGSGTSRRDNPWYLTVVEALQANGVAVLLPDKRGSEQSGGDWRDTSLEELATDTQAAVAFMAQVPGVDPDRIGVVGMSQGGWIAPIVAARMPSLAFVVNMSGAGVTTEEQLVFEEVNNIVELGTYRFVARIAASFTVPAIQRRDTWRALAGYDPLPYWAQVETPVFIAYGEGDTNIPVEESVGRLSALAANFFIRVYPDGGHGIKDPTTGRIQQAYLDDLVSFVVTTQVE